jgi:hypothetical protein
VEVASESDEADGPSTVTATEARDSHCNYLLPNERTDDNPSPMPINGNLNYLSSIEHGDTVTAQHSVNYLTAAEIAAPQTNYLQPSEARPDSDSDSEELTADTRPNLNYLTAQELREGASSVRQSLAPPHVAANRQSVLYLQPSEIEFDEDEHQFGAATLHVPKLVIPPSTPQSGNAYFERAPSDVSLPSPSPLMTPRTVPSTARNYASPATLAALQTARDTLEDSYSDDESDTDTDTRGPGASVAPNLNVTGDTNDMYWNNEYQHVLAMSDSLEKYQRLSRLAQDFVYAAQVSHAPALHGD